MSPYPDCISRVTVLTLSRATVHPGGQAQMTAHLEFIDDAPGYTYAFQLAVQKCSTGLNTECTGSGGPGSSPSNITINPPTLEIVAETGAILGGTGSGDATVTITMPDNVDASVDPAVPHVGVYEFQVTITPVPATAYPGDAVGVTANSLERSWAGPGVGVNLRELNGDLCIVPNGEDPTVHGFIDWGNQADFLGLFGGHFLDESGARTTADFTGRKIWEDRSNGGDSCYVNAVFAGFQPLNDGCRYAGAVYPNPPESEWIVALHFRSCSPPPFGRWGTCCDAGPPVVGGTNAVDGIGFSVHCQDLYMDTYMIADPYCSFYKGQRMLIECREAWGWDYAYVPQPRSIGQVLDWEPLLTDWAVESWRSLPVRNNRYVTDPGVCADPP